MSLGISPVFFLNFSACEMKGGTNHSYHFESFRLDVADRQLLNDGVPVPLTPRAFDVLAVLVQQSPHLVEKDELMQSVWADSCVEEANVARVVYTLRKTLGENENGNRLIETVAKKGYRFVAQVWAIDSNSASDPVAWVLGDELSANRGRFETIDDISDISQPANAYQAYQLSRYYYFKVSFPDLRVSRKWAEEAVRRDVDFAPAYAALAEITVMEAITGLRAPLESFPKAKDALRRATELRMSSAEYYSVAGFVDLICDWNFSGAEENLRMALKLNSHHVFANKSLGEALMFQQRAEEAEKHLRRAQEIEPLGLHNNIILAISYFLARKFDRAVEECEKMLSVYPRFVPAASYRCLAWEQLGKVAEAIVEYEKILREPYGEIARRWVGYAYALAGDMENALKTAAKLDFERSQHYLSPTHQAVIYVALNENDKAFSYLLRGLEERDPWMLWTATDPRFDPLRSDPRFDDLVKQIGIRTNTQ